MTTEDVSLTEDSFPEPPFPQDQDAFLTRLVEYAIHGVELPVTLWVGGRMISGILTSGEHFFADALQALGLDEKQPEGSNAEMMAADFQQWIDVYHEPFSRPPEFIHLKDARTFKGDGNMIPSDKGTMWRGKLSSIDGFHLGALKAER
jgi:hypothetical protein